MKSIRPQTSRLRLRQWREADSEPFAAMNADPQVMEYFAYRLSRLESDQLLARLKAHIASTGWGLWAVELKAGKQFIGFVGLQWAPEQLPFSPCVEVGWRLAKPYWGNGYATEAARSVLAIGFEQLALNEILSFTALPNKRSQAVMERLGMERAQETFEHPLVQEGHPLRTHCLYRLSKRDWLANSCQEAL